MTRISAALASIMIAATTWGAHAPFTASPAHNRAIRVEVPIRDHYIGHHETLNLKKLIARRTDFDPDHYDLTAVVLHARSEHDGHVQLKVAGHRSPRYHIPWGDLHHLRIPTPHASGNGSWRLKVSGGVYIDRLVAVLQPRYETHVGSMTTYRARRHHATYYTYLDRTSQPWPQHNVTFYVHNGRHLQRRIRREIAREHRRNHREARHEHRDQHVALRQVAATQTMKWKQHR
ncbi:MAG: hypothetical protein O7H39_00280 [Gammaproteobacteria bacterium]|nr:hypothetical protein [Gammaproteobacteria bacterium]